MPPGTSRLVQQLSLPVPAGQVVRPGPPGSQLWAELVEPTQAPLLHESVLQGNGGPHCPFASQVSTELPAHCWLPGAQIGAVPPLLDPELLPLSDAPPEPESLPAPLDPEPLPETPLLEPDPLPETPLLEPGPLPELPPPDPEPLLDPGPIGAPPGSSTKSRSVLPPQPAT